MSFIDKSDRSATEVPGDQEWKGKEMDLVRGRLPRRDVYDLNPQGADNKR